MDGKSLKSNNKVPLFGLIVGNIAIFFGVIQSDKIIVGNWALLGQQLVEALPAGLALTLVGIINARTPSSTDTPSNYSASMAC